MRFPEMYVRLVQEMGTDVILAPSAFTVPTGQAHWHTLLRGTFYTATVYNTVSNSFGYAARAIESQCYVIAAAQYGKHNEKRYSYGHSLVVDPWGTIVADAGGVDSEDTMLTPSIVTCEIDPALIASTRERMPIQQHRANADHLNSTEG